MKSVRIGRLRQVCADATSDYVASLGSASKCKRLRRLAVWSGRDSGGAVMDSSPHTGDGRCLDERLLVGNKAEYRLGQHRKSAIQTLVRSERSSGFRA